jgi:anti-anti-sigma factor
VPPQGLLIEIQGAGDADQAPARDEPPPFQLIRDEGRLAVAGSVDTFGADRLAQLLASSPVVGPAVTLDLRGTTFVDSAGVHLAVEADAWAARNGTRFAIIAGPPSVHSIFELTGLSASLPFVDVPRG